MKNSATKKWILQRVTGIIIAPIVVWFFVKLNSLRVLGYSENVAFFSDKLFLILTAILFFGGFFHLKMGIAEIFEDYIGDEKVKNVANTLVLISSIIVPLIAISLLLKL